MATGDAQLRAYYEQGKERDRLAGPKGSLEFARTKEIIQRRLPPAPAVVADIGGGPDASVDAVLVLGPLYHLPERADRIKSLYEAGRIGRPGSPIFIAAISRWAPRLDGVLQERLYEHSPEFLSLLPDVERDGSLPPVVPNGFLGYTHRPTDLADEIAEAGLHLDDLVGVEGLPLAAADMQARAGDTTAWNVLLDAARAIERVPELLGVSPHLIATATTG